MEKAANIMARVHLEVDDYAQRMTLRAMLEVEGHTVGSEAPDLVFCDSVPRAIARAKTLPVIVLATASEIPEAVRAMREGVAAYIFMPLQPGEAGQAVRQVLSSRSTGGAAQTTSAEAMRPLAEIELDYIQTVLRKCGNNQARAARILGIGRNTLWRKLRKSGDAAKEDAAG